MSTSTPTRFERARGKPDLRPENRPYEPRGSALAVLYDHAPQVLLSGPSGTGKSRASLEKLHLVAERYPGCRVLIVRKTRASCTESCLVTYEEKVLPPNHPVLGGIQRRNRHSYDYPNGSQVVVGGMDDPEKVKSSEWDLIYVNEATELTENDWELLTTRNRNGVVPYQQVLGDCNPSFPRHWLKLKCDAGQVTLHESRFEDNPVLWDAHTRDWTPRGVVYLRVLDALTGARKLRLRFGRWAQAEGVVYPEYDAAVHLIDRFPVPPDWPRFRAIDFGFTNPFVCQWWAVDGDGRIYMYREIYHTQRTVRAHATRVKALERWYLTDNDGNDFDDPAREVIEACVTDHDAEDRATLEEEGLDTEAAHKAVSPGIEGVKERLKPAADGKPRLYLMRDSLVERDPELAGAKKPCATAEEFDSYLWAPAKEGKAAGEEPVKLHDHGMDCCRYACAYADRRGTHWIEVY